MSDELALRAAEALRAYMNKYVLPWRCERDEQLLAELYRAAGIEPRLTQSRQRAERLNHG